MNKIFKKKIIRYLKIHPDEGLQTFVDEMDGDYIEQVLHELARVLQEYDVPYIMAKEPVFEQIQILLSRKIEPTENAMIYKEMNMSAAEYFKLMYGMLLDTIRQSQQRQTRKKRSSLRSKKGGRKNRKTRSSRKI